MGKPKCDAYDMAVAAAESAASNKRTVHADMVYYHAELRKTLARVKFEFRLV